MIIARLACRRPVASLTSRGNQTELTRIMSSESPKHPPNIAIIQMTSGSKKSENLNFVTPLMKEAVEKKVKMIFLPEAFDFISGSSEETFHLSEFPHGPTLSFYKAFAKEHRVWLSLGGFHERLSDRTIVVPIPLISNTHFVINEEGVIVGRYGKIHLFDLHLPSENIRLHESATVQGGKELVAVDTPIGRLGLGICYDLRFPEMSGKLNELGAQILTFPSAFTVPTGSAHWEVLLRARAIENQSFVIAAAQTGKHNDKRCSYGHSMVVDPWGKILNEAADKPGIVFAHIDVKEVEKVREKMPISEHKKKELYTPLARDEFQWNTSDFYFAHTPIPSYMCFMETSLSRAIVNRKCVLPGHVLVMPKRIAIRFGDLSAPEVTDLFLLAQKVQKLMEKFTNSQSSQIVIQDGPDAGRTIPHVHIHVIPRSGGDFIENDDIYAAIEKHDKGSKVVWREPEEMEEEANQLRVLAREMML